MAPQIITVCENLTQQLGFCASKMTFNLKRGLWTSEQQSSSFCSCKSVLMLSLVQLFGTKNGTTVSLFLKTSVRCVSSFSPFHVNLSQVFESALFYNVLKVSAMPAACAPFPDHFFVVVPAQSTFHEYAQIQPSPFSNNLLCLMQGHLLVRSERSKPEVSIFSILGMHQKY